MKNLARNNLLTDRAGRCYRLPKEAKEGLAVGLKAKAE